MSDPGIVSCRIQVNTPVANGAGGTTDAWTDHATGLNGRLRNAAPRPYQYADAAPGIVKRNFKIMIFYRPFNVTLNEYREYRFVLSDGSVWFIEEWDDYEETVQFSVSRVYTQ